MSTCHKCEAGWEHCHGTLIRHSHRHSECTQWDCPGAELVPHAVVLDCDAIGCVCDQPMGSSAASALGA